MVTRSPKFIASLLLAATWLTFSGCTETGPEAGPTKQEEEGPDNRNLKRTSYRAAELIVSELSGTIEERYGVKVYQVAANSKIDGDYFKFKLTSPSHPGEITGEFVDPFVLTQTLPGERLTLQVQACVVPRRVIDEPCGPVRSIVTKNLPLRPVSEIDRLAVQLKEENAALNKKMCECIVPFESYWNVRSSQSTAPDEVEAYLGDFVEAGCYTAARIYQSDQLEQLEEAVQVAVADAKTASGLQLTEGNRVGGIDAPENPDYDPENPFSLDTDIFAPVEVGDGDGGVAGVLSRIEKLIIPIGVTSAIVGAWLIFVPGFFEKPLAYHLSKTSYVAEIIDMNIQFRQFSDKIGAKLSDLSDPDGTFKTGTNSVKLAFDRTDKKMTVEVVNTDSKKIIRLTGADGILIEKPLGDLKPADLASETFAKNLQRDYLLEADGFGKNILHRHFKLNFDTMLNGDAKAFEKFYGLRDSNARRADKLEDQLRKFVERQSGKADLPNAIFGDKGIRSVDFLTANTGLDKFRNKRIVEVVIAGNDSYGPIADAAKTDALRKSGVGAVLKKKSNRSFFGFLGDLFSKKKKLRLADGTGDAALDRLGDQMVACSSELSEIRLRIKGLEYDLAVATDP